MTSIGPGMLIIHPHFSALLVAVANRRTFWLICPNTGMSFVNENFTSEAIRRAWSAGADVCAVGKDELNVTTM